MTKARSSLVRTVAVALPPVLFLLLPVHAQDARREALGANDAMVRFYLDCEVHGCRDDDFFRTEIDFVTWVREPQDAEVYLLVTSQTTGAGGQSYDLFFMGQSRFEGMADTLRYVGGYDATEDELRRGLGDVTKMGLMRYVASTSIAQDIRIGLKGEEGGPPRGGSAIRPEDDPWNFWVFRARLNLYASGESTYKSTNLGASFTASRTTEAWKTSLRIGTSYNESRFDYEDVDELTVTRSHYLEALQVKSLTDHWSVGVRGGLSSSTYSNLRLSTELAPVLEYNVFPYSESTRRSLTVQYSWEHSYVDYVEETVFFKENEHIVTQNLGARMEFTQPWGSTNLYATGGHFVNDLDRHNATIGGEVEFRVVRGLSVNVFGRFSRIQDRVSVPASDFDVDDVLLRRRQLQTDYTYYCILSLSYSFGSVFNNIVNPRLDSF